MSRAEANETSSLPWLRFTLPYEPSRLLRARERIRNYLHRLRLEEICIDEVILAVMEAATNAMRHSAGTNGIEISLAVRDGEVEARVRDDGRGFNPQAFDTERPPDLSSDSGRGLFLMEQLMDAVEYRFEAGTEVLMRKRIEFNLGGRAVAPLLAGEAGGSGVKHVGETLVEAIDHIEGCLCTLDWDWRFLYLNRAAACRYEPAAEAMVGRDLFDVFPELHGSACEQTLRAAMDQGAVGRYEGYFEPACSWVELRVAPAPFGIVVFYQELGDLGRAEEATARRGGDGSAGDVQALTAITRLLEAALVCRDEEELGQACLAAVGDLTQSAVGFIGELSEEGRLFTVAVSASPDDASAVAGEGPPPDAAAVLERFVMSDLHEAVVSGGVALTVGAEERERVAGQAAEPRVSSYLGVPLRRAGKTYGIVAVGNRAGGYGEAQRSALETVAPVITQVVDGLRARVALHTALSQTKVLAGVAAAVAGAEEPEQVCEAVLVEAALHLGLKAGSVNQLDEDEGVLRRVATFGAGFADPRMRAPIPHDGSTNVSRMLQLGLPYLSHESPRQCVSSLERFADMGLAEDSWIKLPITAGEKVIGALTLVFPGTRSFRAADIGFFRSVADQLGVALQRAQLAGERERQRRLLERTAAHSLALDRVNDLVRGVDESADAIGDAAGLAAAALEARLCAVWLLEGRAWRRFRGAAAPDCPPDEGDEEPAAAVRGARSPIVVCPLRHEGRAAEGAGAHEALLAVPLVSGAERLGVALFATPADRVFWEGDFDFLGKLGAALGGALENIGLYAALNKQLELSQVLLRASKVLTEWTDLAPMLDRLAGVLLLSAPDSRASVALVNLERHELQLAASRGSGRLRRDVFSLDILPDGVRELLVAPATLVSDYAVQPHHRIVYPHDFFAPRFGLCVPVVSRGQAVGLLTLEATEVRAAFTPDEIVAIEAIADQAATAIENARLYDAEVEAQRRGNRELEISQLLLTTAATFASETDPDRLLDVVVRTLNRTFDNARVSISLATAEGVHTIVAASGPGAWPVGAVYEPEDFTPPALRALRLGQAALVDYDALSDEDAGVSRGFGARYGIVAPLVSRGRTIGALTIDHAHVRREFTARDVSLAQGIADQAAIALYNADMFEKVREEARFGEALDEAGRLLHSTLDDDTILAGALESGGRALQAASGVICISERGVWVVRYQFGYAVDLVGRAWSDDAVPFMAEARRLRGPVRLGDARGADADLAGASTPPGVRAVLTVPLVTSDEVIGVLVYNKPVAHAFSAAEETFAVRLARSVSLALQNARLFANEHTIAETLQGALLAMPEKLDGFDVAYAYHSATVAARVGGDFYDVFELGDAEVGVVVGDISGKGLDAAVTTSVVKNAIRAQAFERTKSPADVLRIVNEVLVRSSEPELFASVFFGVLDRRNGKLRYCNAGHTPGLVVRAGGEVLRLEHTAPVIGAFPGLPFRYADAVVEPGELLFLYTDGLIEARTQGLLFGEEGLLRLFADPAMRDARLAVQRVAAAVVEFTGGLLSDDLALLAVVPRRNAER